RASWPMRMVDMGDLRAGAYSLQSGPESRVKGDGGGVPLPPPAGEGWDGGTLRRGTGCHRDLRQGAPTPALPRTRGREKSRVVRSARPAPSPACGGRLGWGARSGAEPLAIATRGRLPPTPTPSPARGGGRGAASGAAGRLLPPPAGECRDGGAVRLPGQGGAVR